MAGYTLGQMFQFRGSTRRPRRPTRDLLVKEGSKVTYQVWGNPIAVLNTKRKTLTTSDAGWQTNLTKNRLNQVIPYGHVIQRQRQFKFQYMKNNEVKTIPLKGGMRFNLRKLGY